MVVYLADHSADYLEYRSADYSADYLVVDSAVLMVYLSVDHLIVCSAVKKVGWSVVSTAGS